MKKTQVTRKEYNNKGSFGYQDKKIPVLNLVLVPCLDEFLFWYLRYK